MRYLKLLTLLMAAPFLLVACSGEPKEQMYDSLEEAVKQEETFREQQKPLQELEAEEEEIYNQIVELTSEETEEINKLSEEALSIVNERSKLLEKEKESIEAAKEEFDKAEGAAEDLESDAAKEAADKLIEKMDQRYKAYQELYDHYQTALSLDKELYEMLQNEDLTKDDLQAKVDEINESYSAVIEANEQFNQYTTEYNDLKKGFYEAAELDVSYEE
ncbi:YkyA family protein [Halobacillus sp. Marseille-Q1614]|uniref:YkyA family protein n=1 Tax=Halobacillus sp. Marseille-Q1614 TaxID=2709134 RepID=UPI0020C235CD|nr:YkyA family protein [Halobacillus sp. Marseille-Q1614]